MDLPSISVRARNAFEAFRFLQDHYNTILNKVLTRYRLQLTPFGAKHERALLAFLDPRRQPTAVHLDSSPWYVALGQELEAVPAGREYALKVPQYAYRIQRTPSVYDEAEVRFEYVSQEVDPKARWCRHHVQFHRDYHDVREGFSPQKCHIPTGGVTIEDVIRFLVTDLGVPPLIETWDEELRKRALEDSNLRPTDS